MSWMTMVGLDRGPIEFKDERTLKNAIFLGFLAGGMIEEAAQKKSDEAWKTVGDSDNVWSASLSDGRKFSVWREGGR